MDDVALHTLMRFEEFYGERERLVQRTGDLRTDPGGQVLLMLESPDNWNAMVNFAGAVISTKESAECERQGRGAGEAMSQVHKSPRPSGRSPPTLSRSRTH